MLVNVHIKFVETFFLTIKMFRIKNFMFYNDSQLFKTLPISSPYCTLVLSISFSTLINTFRK